MAKRQKTQKQREWMENDNYKSKYSKLRGDIDVTFEVEIKKVFNAF